MSVPAVLSGDVYDAAFSRRVAQRLSNARQLSIQMRRVVKHSAPSAEPRRI